MNRTKKPIKFKEIYFTSSITSEIEKFEIIESSINFSESEFANDCKLQMNDLDLSIAELSKLTYLNESRIFDILNCRGSKIKEEEIKIIKKKLCLS